MSSDHGEFDGTPTEPETTSTVGNLPRGSRETPVSSVAPMAADRSGKARRHNPDAHDAGETTILRKTSRKKFRAELARQKRGGVKRIGDLMIPLLVRLGVSLEADVESKTSEARSSD